VPALALPAGCSVSFCPMETNIKRLTRFVIASLFILGLEACSNETQKPAPLGEHAVLEQLAKAYDAVGEQYPVRPQSMPPKGRREFVERVFRQAGYSYSATLLAMAQPGADTTNQEQRDLAELLLLPAKGLSDEGLDTLFTDDELLAVKRVKKDFR
jgi:hypothetical protein